MSRIYILHRKESNTCFSINNGVENRKPSIVAFTRPKEAEQFKGTLKTFQTKCNVNVAKVNRRDLYNACASGGLDIVLFTKTSKSIKIKTKPNLLSNLLRLDSEFDEFDSDMD